MEDLVLNERIAKSDLRELELRLAVIRVERGKRGRLGNTRDLRASRRRRCQASRRWHEGATDSRNRERREQSRARGGERGRRGLGGSSWIRGGGCGSGRSFLGTRRARKLLDLSQRWYGLAFVGG